MNADSHRLIQRLRQFGWVLTGDLTLSDALLAPVIVRHRGGEETLDEAALLVDAIEALRPVARVWRVARIGPAPEGVRETPLAVALHLWEQPFLHRLIGALVYVWGLSVTQAAAVADVPESIARRIEEALQARARGHEDDAP